MKLLLIPALLLASLALLMTPLASAADPDGVAMYTAADIKSRAAATKLDANKAGADRVATWGNHGLLLVRREGDGAAETHNTQVDIVTVVSGEGTLVVGGTMVGAKTTAQRNPRHLDHRRHEAPDGDRRRIPHSRRCPAPDAGAEEPRHSGC